MTRPLRILILPLALLGAYFVLRPFAVTMSATHGFGSPDDLGLTFLALTATVTTLRILLIVVVPAYLAYRLVIWAVGRSLTRERSRTPVASDSWCDPPGRTSR